MKVIDTQVEYDEYTDDCFLVTKYDTGAIHIEPITAEEGAKYQAQHGF